LTALLLLMLAQDGGYRNVAREWGLTQTFPNGGAQTKKFIIETTGSGAALVDVDRDGFLDAFVLSGPGGSNRLYRNQQGRRFVDVTAAYGVGSRDAWAQGVCAGDFDQDGWPDLLVTYWGGVQLWRNEQGQRFRDVTAATGLNQAGPPRYNTGCAFVDFDRDGDLDLFVANYLVFDPATTPGPGANPYCYYRGMAVNCGPRGLPFARNLLYRNDGGKFVDVSTRAGIAEPVGHYALGVLTGDFNADGWPDIYVAGDQTPSLLYLNQRNGKFVEEAVLRGAAFDENGRALSGMGVAAGDYDGDGWPDIFRTNFSDERETLYRNRGQGEFDDVTAAAGLARNTRFVGWGCAFLDFDLDGWLDLVLVNGHVFPEVDRLGLAIKYKDRAILYRNTGRGTFLDVSEQAGPAVSEPHSARGLAVGDLDNDGTLEVLINNQNEAPSLWKRPRDAQAHWLMVDLGPAAMGAKVRLTAGGRTQTQEVRSGGSYLSQSDLRVHFGLGAATRVESLEIEWLDGSKQLATPDGVDRVVVVRPGAARERGKGYNQP
jgi:hypothetical protein